jgi:hypothetical protein
MPFYHHVRPSDTARSPIHLEICCKEESDPGHHDAFGRGSPLSSSLQFPASSRRFNPLARGCEPCAWLRLPFLPELSALFLLPVAQPILVGTAQASGWYITMGRWSIYSETYKRDE